MQGGRHADFQGKTRYLHGGVVCRTQEGRARAAQARQERDRGAAGNSSRTANHAGAGSGLVKEWNRKHSSGTEVAPGDSIMAVNGVTGDTQAMVAQIQASRTRLHLLIRGPPPPPSRAKK